MKGRDETNEPVSETSRAGARFAGVAKERAPEMARVTRAMENMAGRFKLN